MTVQEAISARHSVRTYLTKPVEPAIVNALRAEMRVQRRGRTAHPARDE